MLSRSGVGVNVLAQEDTCYISVNIGNAKRS